MTQLGNGLAAAKHHEDALTVREAELSMARRQGAPEEIILSVQNNLAATYQALGREEQALHTRRDVYSGMLKIKGGEHEKTLLFASNYVKSLIDLRRFEEAKSLLHKTIPVARRVLGEDHLQTLELRWGYGAALRTACATLNELRESVNTLEDIARTALRVLGGVHPVTTGIERDLRRSRDALAAREGTKIK